MTDEPYRYTQKAIRSLRERIEILAGIDAALQRWPEVAKLAFESESPGTLRNDLAALLDIGPEPAQAILDMQVRRVTRRERARISSELEESRRQLRAALSDPRPPV